MPSNKLCISFNGGKDCTVILHLLCALRCEAGLVEPLRALYIGTADPFPEIGEFVGQAVARYGLALETVTGRSIRDGLGAFLGLHADLQAIAMGTRRDDPHASQLRPFTPTDAHWPQIMRVNPILDWHYGDVWTVMQRLGIPYCSLYDQGYSSLGDRHNTAKNPLLCLPDGTHLPAYALVDGASERAGRPGVGVASCT